jgi:hypothetical protein
MGILQKDSTALLGNMEIFNYCRVTVCHKQFGCLRRRESYTKQSFTILDWETNFLLFLHFAKKCIFVANVLE